MVIVISGDIMGTKTINICTNGNVCEKWDGGGQKKGEDIVSQLKMWRRKTSSHKLMHVVNCEMLESNGVHACRQGTR